MGLALGLALAFGVSLQKDTHLCEGKAHSEHLYVCVHHAGDGLTCGG